MNTPKKLYNLASIKGKKEGRKKERKEKKEKKERNISKRPCMVERALVLKPDD